MEKVASIFCPLCEKQVILSALGQLRINFTCTFKVFQISLVASRLGQFCEKWNYSLIALGPMRLHIRIVLHSVQLLLQTVWLNHKLCDLIINCDHQKSQKILSCTENGPRLVKRRKNETFPPSQQNLVSWAGWMTPYLDHFICVNILLSRWSFFFLVGDTLYSRRTVPAAMYFVVFFFMFF